MNPKVSILIPSYNHSQHVERAVRSVWDQTYRNIELIVIDDGSSDGSQKILKRLCKESPIPMKYKAQSNIGLTPTLNRLLDMASGEYVSLLASDDIYLPCHSQVLVESIAASGEKNVSFAYGDVELIDQNEKSIGRTQFQNKSPKSGGIFEDILLFKYFPQGSANLYNRSILVQAGGFNPKYRGEGLDLYLKLTLGHNVVYVDKVLSKYRIGSGTLNIAIADHLPERIEIWFKHFKKHYKYSDEDWRRMATSNFYFKIGSDFYVIRELGECAKWLFRSILKKPTNIRSWKLMLRVPLMAGLKLIRKTNS